MKGQQEQDIGTGAYKVVNMQEKQQVSRDLWLISVSCCFFDYVCNMATHKMSTKVELYSMITTLMAAFKLHMNV